MNFDIEKYTTTVIARFKKVRPDWHPPFKTAFSVAREMGKRAVINDVSEAEWDAEWDDWFDNDDTAEMEKLEIVLHGKPGEPIVTVHMHWDDLRQVSVKTTRKSKALVKKAS